MNEMKCATDNLYTLQKEQKHRNWAQIPEIETHSRTHQKEFSHQFLLEAIKIDENSESIVQFHSAHRSKFMVISALGNSFHFGVRSKQFSVRSFNLSG